MATIRFACSIHPLYGIASHSPCLLQRTIRHVSTLQRRKPSRMVLSGTVRRAPSTPEASSGKPQKRKSRNSPFAAMNQTRPPREGGAGKYEVSAAEKRRSSRFAKEKKEKPQRDPMKALKMQRRLATVSWDRRGKTLETIKQRSTFDEFELLQVVKEAVAAQALPGLVDLTPTPIQRLAIPALLDTQGRPRRKKRLGQELQNEEDFRKQERQYLLAAETGSGKTLAYVLPVVNAIKAAENEEKMKKELEKENQTKKGQMFDLEPPPTRDDAARPRAIILLPTAELVDQVGALVKNISHKVKLRVAMVSTAYSSTVIKNRLFSVGGIDVVITTPHLLSSVAQTEPNLLARVTHLVVDEADSLFDRSFKPITVDIINRVAESMQQLILCSATIPRSLDGFLEKRYPRLTRLVTPNLHAIPRRVQLSVVDIEKTPFQGNRDLACAQTIWDISSEASETESDKLKKILVFVNEREKSVELTNFLRSKGIDAFAMSRDTDDRQQAEIMAEFTGPIVAKTQRDDGKVVMQAGRAARQLRNAKVAVMTDLGSRGIDTLMVRHVILYDVPHTSIDFIHRLGRVGRMNRRGRGIVLVGRKDRKDIVREVREGMFKGQALI